MKGTQIGFAGDLLGRTEPNPPDHDRAARLWNAHFADAGGSIIRWQPDVNEFTTANGERYSESDVYGTVRGLDTTTEHVLELVP